ncbi:MAG: hypothetical protein KKB79_00395 [Nanoarchaeota archaeon]|nr:hypothetical protein [Nanoarchaeota archaeon]
MRKSLRDLLATSTLVIGGLVSGCETTYVITNYGHPEAFYGAERSRSEGRSSSGSDDSALIATIGSVMGIFADTKRDAAISSALTTYGTLKSNEEAARAGKTEVNVTQNVQTESTVVDATSVREYDLFLLQKFYEDGHLGYKKKVFTHIYEEYQQRGFPKPDDPYPVDGLQYLFTYNRAVDMTGDGLSFDEFLGVKRNFVDGEPVSVCVGVRGGATGERNGQPVNARVRLELFSEDEGALSEDVKSVVFSGQHQDILLFWKLNNLDPGFYTLNVNYSDDYDSVENRGGRDNEPMLRTLKQFFQIPK